MHVHLLAVPYDSGVRDVRMGVGPTHLLEHGLADALRARGHDTLIEFIDVPRRAPPGEIAMAFNLARALAARVRHARSVGAIPLVLSGNCSSALGTVAALSREHTGVVWFDSHGDLNTPETTSSGFFDGMALATVAGRCWQELARAVPNFHPVELANVVLLGAHDFDPGELELIRSTPLCAVDAARLRSVGPTAALEAPLGALASRVDVAYVHVDLDVLHPSEGRVNQFPSVDGLTAAELRECLELVARRCQLGAAALTAYDPAVDTDARVRATAINLATTIIDAAAEQRATGITSP